MKKTGSIFTGICLIVSLLCLYVSPLTAQAAETNRLYLSNHFTDGIGTWSASTAGEGTIKTENGIVNISSYGGEPIAPVPAESIEKGTAYVTDATASSTGWTINDAANALTISDGVMTIEPTADTLSQAEYLFTPHTNTFVTQFDVKLTYGSDAVAALGIQLFDGTYRNFIQIFPGSVIVRTNPVVTYSNAKTQSGVWYTYRIEQTAGHTSVMRKAEDATVFEVLGEGLVMNKNAASARVKFYIENAIKLASNGFRTDIRNVEVHNTATRPVVNPVGFTASPEDTDEFTEESVSAAGWATSSSTISVLNDALHVQANGTAAQVVTKPLADFSKLEYEMKYRMNNMASRAINIELRNKTHRAVVSVYPTKMTMRSTAGSFYDAAGIGTDLNSWYTLKVVMELFDGKTQDYRYSVYRKIGDEGDYLCIASNLPAQAFSGPSQAKLFVENDNTIDCDLDYVKTRTYTRMFTNYVQKIQSPYTPDSTHFAEVRVRLNQTVNNNGANVILYTGTSRAFLRIQSNRVTLVDYDCIPQVYDVTNTEDTWYTYLIHVKNGTHADVYRKMDGGAYTKIIDNQDLQENDAAPRAEIFVEANEDTEIDADIDYFRSFVGVVLDNKTATVSQDGTQTVVAADIVNGTSDQLSFDAIASIYDGEVFAGVGTDPQIVGGMDSKRISVPVNATGTASKLFIWNSLSTMEPLEYAE